MFLMHFQFCMCANMFVDPPMTLVDMKTLFPLDFAFVSWWATKISSFEPDFVCPACSNSFFHITVNILLTSLCLANLDPYSQFRVLVFAASLKLRVPIIQEQTFIVKFAISVEQMFINLVKQKKKEGRLCYVLNEPSNESASST